MRAARHPPATPAITPPATARATAASASDTLTRARNTTSIDRP
jgi:hypothetical protein